VCRDRRAESYRSEAGNGRPAIQCLEVSARYGRVAALSGVDLAAAVGSVHGLIGGNGAGKTTLLRILSGELAPSSGTVTVDGRVSFVRQNLSLVPGLTVLENVIFGAEPARFGVINWSKVRSEVSRKASELDLDLPLDSDVASLPLAMQQQVELLRAIWRGSNVLLLDEPTAYLGQSDSEMVLRYVREYASRGATVMLVSHRLRDVASVCHAITVLREGRIVADMRDPPFHETQLLSALIGSSTGRVVRPQGRDESDVQPLAFVRNGTHVVLRGGTIVGVGGSARDGQDELVAHLAGIGRDAGTGRTWLFGEDVTTLGVAARRRRGLRVIPADTRGAGAVLNASLRDNILTSEVPGDCVGRFGRLLRGPMEDRVAETLRRWVRGWTNPGQPAAQLSGGNLQRLVVGRELDAEAKVVIAHEPTRGLDPSATAEVRRALGAFVETGTRAVLLLSSDWDELHELADSIYVMQHGRLTRPSSGRMPGQQSDAGTA
jgi:general nucleoside transport system ATP-binding protein